MALTLLLTGFGPFPGAPINPTGWLIDQLVRRRHPAFMGVRRITHVFETSYEAVDREWPALLAHERPNVVVMFGLAPRSRHIRIETIARNALAQRIPDAVGQRPLAATIAIGGPAALPLPAPAPRLVAAARASGVPTALSRNAGAYLCNYLCWRASDRAPGQHAPRLMTFVHVPLVRPAQRSRSRLMSLPVTSDDLARAGEAIVIAAITAARSLR